MRISGGFPWRAALLAALFVACKTQPTGPGTPPALAIVNRSHAAYTFGVSVLTGTKQVDTLQHSTGNDSVCTSLPAVGNAYEVLFATPDDSLNPPLETQVFAGSASTGWVLFFGPKAVGNDTLVLTLSASGVC